MGKLRKSGSTVSQVSTLTSPSPSEIRQIEQICDDFEAAWRAGERPVFESYLDRVAPPLGSELLHHLVALDWEYRAAAGEEPLSADYVKRFPILAATIDSIRHEVAAANDNDEKPTQRLGPYRIIRQVGRGGMG